MKMLIRNILFGLILFGGICGCSSATKQTSPLAHRYGPKNVIIFIADGCGFNHYKSSDYYNCGHSPCQPYEGFPVRLAMSTYPQGGSYDANLAWHSFNYVDKGATDSAAAATAMATGVKTHNKTLGLDNYGRPVLNLSERAKQLGKAAGVITTVFFDDATPAGFVVHNGARGNLTQIADDMLDNNSVDCIMGAGHPFYDSDGRQAQEPNYKYISKETWANLKNGSAGGSANPWTLVQTRAEFQALAAGKTPNRVFGLVQVYDTTQQKRSGEDAAPYETPLTQTVPTLEEMTLAALNVLDEDPNGFFVMIEGGAVDWAAHANESGRLIEEMNDFNKSIEAVIHWVDTNSNWNETLVIITADHETGHLTCPNSGQIPEGPVWNELAGNGIGKLPAMEWHSKNHTNSLVPFFAKGAGAEQFTETIDGNDSLRGPYIDNTDIANTVFTLWNTK
ncbi:MAG: alkaline phosphatase [Planctomycetes bacterium]|nr:alkaline phosphatase [Planctomycetota bacterium]